MRSLAAKMGGSDAAILMTDLAAEYDRLAERAAIRANGKKPRSNGSRAKKCGAVSIAGGSFDRMASGKRKPPAPGGGSGKRQGLARQRQGETIILAVALGSGSHIISNA
jgi:hypothetical protein